MSIVNLQLAIPTSNGAVTPNTDDSPAPLTLEQFLSFYHVFGEPSPDLQEAIEHKILGTSGGSVEALFEYLANPDAQDKIDLAYKNLEIESIDILLYYEGDVFHNEEKENNNKNNTYLSFYPGTIGQLNFKKYRSSLETSFYYRIAQLDNLALYTKGNWDEIKQSIKTQRTLDDPLTLEHQKAIQIKVSFELVAKENKERRNEHYQKIKDLPYDSLSPADQKIQWEEEMWPKIHTGWNFK